MRVVEVVEIVDWEFHRSQLFEFHRSQLSSTTANRVQLIKIKLFHNHLLYKTINQPDLVGLLVVSHLDRKAAIFNK